jgi:hypothetical protein
VALSPRANYTDSATSTCRRNLVSTFVDRGVSRGQRGGSPTVVNLSFLDRCISNYSFKLLNHILSHPYMLKSSNVFIHSKMNQTQAVQPDSRSYTELSRLDAHRVTQVSPAPAGNQTQAVQPGSRSYT